MFFLKPADGAVGGHAAAVRDVYLDYQKLARRIADGVLEGSAASPSPVSGPL